MSYSRNSVRCVHFALDGKKYILYIYCMDIAYTIRDLVKQWPSIRSFAVEIGCGYEAAKKMIARNSISPSHWHRVIVAANAKELSWVTLDWLVSIRAASNKNRRQQHE